MEMNVIDQSLSEAAQFFKLLAHPGRLAILEILREGEHCVCHMEAYTGFRQAYISQQLAVLREAGWITDRRDGWNIFYRVTNPGIFNLLDNVYQLTAQTRNAPVLVKPICTCPHCSIPQQG